MNTKLASGLTAITCCLFLIGCEQKVSDPWPEILAKSVDDINICLDTEAVDPMKFQYPILTVYTNSFQESENSFDITSVTLGSSLGVPLRGFDLVSFKCKGGDLCVTIKNLETGNEIKFAELGSLTNWREDCSMMEAMNANRGIYNLVEYSMLKDEEAQQPQ